MVPWCLIIRQIHLVVTPNRNPKAGPPAVRLKFLLLVGRLLKDSERISEVTGHWNANARLRARPKQSKFGKAPRKNFLSWSNNSSVRKIPLL